MLAVWMMKMSAHQVIDMITMGDSLVTAARTVGVLGIVRFAVVAGSAVCRIRSADRDRVVVNVAIVHVMQMSIV